MKYTLVFALAICSLSSQAQTRVYTEQEKRESIPPKEVAVYGAPKSGPHQRKLMLVRNKPHPALSPEENAQIMKRREKMIHDLQAKKAAGS